MSGTSAPTAAAPGDDGRLKFAVERGVKFQIKAGNQKWACTILDRNTHERQKAIRTSSSSSVSTTSTTESK